MGEIFKKSETTVNIQENIETLPIQYVIYNIKKKSSIPTKAYNEYGFDNHLILPEIDENFKMFDFFMVW